jgi:hypothetical protein
LNLHGGKIMIFLLSPWVFDVVFVALLLASADVITIAAAGMGWLVVRCWFRRGEDEERLRETRDAIGRSCFHLLAEGSMMLFIITGVNATSQNFIQIPFFSLLQDECFFFIHPSLSTSSQRILFSITIS